MTKNASTMNPATRAVTGMLAATLALGTVGLGSLAGCAGGAGDTATTEAAQSTEVTSTEAADATDEGATAPQATVLTSAPQVEEGWPGVERPHEYGMSDGEAVYDAREYLGVDEGDVETLDIARVWYEDRGCYDVSIQVKDAASAQHVLVDAQNGEVLANWTD